MKDLIEKSKSIYNMLGDEQSRKIFEHRLMYSLTDDYGYVFRMANYTDEMNAIKSKLKKISGGGCTAVWCRQQRKVHTRML